jgi:hypothetical protein
VIQIVPLQSIALYLLLFILAPRAVEIISPTVFVISIADAKHLVSASLDIAGFIAIGIGAWRISGGPLLLLLIIDLIVYGVLEAQFNLYCLGNACTTTNQMTPGYALTFAALKLCFTIIFGCMVAHNGMTREWRDAGPMYWCLHFVDLAPAPPHKKV